MLSIALAAAPFAFGLLRAYRTGYDLRMLWMAFASFLGASMVEAIRRACSRTRNHLLALSAVTLIMATLFAGATAFLLGARSAAGVWPVAFVFGVSWAASYALAALSRPRPV